MKGKDSRFWLYYTHYGYLHDYNGKTVGIDIDGVLADFVGRSVIYARQVFGVDFNVEDVNRWDMSECTPLTKEQYTHMFRDPDFYALERAHPGAAAAVWHLARQYNIIYVTARVKETSAATITWLRANKFAPGFLIHCTDKVQIARIFGIEYFLEDNLPTLVTLAPVIERGFLFDQLYNQGCEPDNVQRVYRPWWANVLRTLLSSELSYKDTPSVCKRCGRFHSEQV